MGKIVGFTGTQHGMSDRQYAAFYRMIEGMKPSELHHGDCIGADAQAHAATRLMPFHVCIVKYPPLDTSKQANCIADEERERKEYLVRNHDIVDECEALIAIPRTSREIIRSCTWATVRYAREAKKEIIIIMPSGMIKDGSKS